MEGPLFLQFLIALFTGMVAATFVPPVRRSIPRPIEVLLWLGLFAVCAVGILSVTDPNARELSASAAWGADQVLNAAVGMTLGDLAAWVSDHRFPIVSWMVTVAGADMLVLVLLRSRRAGRAWQPRVRLREWMEIPMPPAAPQPVAAGDAISALNRKLTAGLAVAGTTTLTKILDLAIWMRDVFVPRAARTGRLRSRLEVEPLRDVAAQLQYAALSWYLAAGRPALGAAVLKAHQAVRQARQARRALWPVTARAGQVIDIRTLLNAQSIGWYGPLLPAPTALAEDESDGIEPERSDRLAS